MITTAGAASFSLVVTSCSQGTSDTSEPLHDEPVLVVLDYSPTISDVGALLYLATSPAVELAAITMPGTGEADCRAATEVTRSVLTAVNHRQVPVGCGAEEPLGEGHDWPVAFREAASALRDQVGPNVPWSPPDDAGSLLARVLMSADRPITLVAVAPLTNIGSLLADQPRLADKVQRIVVMAGAVDVPGNVDQFPTAEWNAHIDPVALRRTLGANLSVDLVALDATNDVPWRPETLAAVLDMNSAAGEIERQVISTVDNLDGWSMWDELTAVVAVKPQVVQFQTRRISVDPLGTTTNDPGGSAVRLAVAADSDAFIHNWLSALNP